MLNNFFSKKTLSLFCVIFISKLVALAPIDSLYNSSIKKINLDYKTSEADFTWDNIEKWYPVSKEVEDGRGEAYTSFQEIDEKKAWIEAISAEGIQELPVGIKHTRENIEYAIGIIKANIYKDYTSLTVFARVRLPQTKSEGKPIELFFGANNVKLSHQGGIIGEANLVLLGDMHIPFNGGKWMLMLKGGFDYRTGNTQNQTYVTIDCDGVKELAIQGVVEFSRKLLLPVETDGTVKENITHVSKLVQSEKGNQTIQVPYRVQGEFNIKIKNWNDILVDINLQPFVLANKRNKKDYKGNFQFHVNKAVFDFSDLRNDLAVKFPENYYDNGLLLPNEESWRGVYVKTIQVKLPEEFKTRESINENAQVSFEAHHLLIDNYGVSGTFIADNVFPLNEGRTNKTKGWAYSLEHIEVSLVANSLVKADLEGRILLPVSKEDENNKKLGLRYRGLISEDEYLMQVSNDSIINFDLWQAKATLLPNSSIELKVGEDGEFNPKAILNGNLSIEATKDNGNKLVDFKGINFQNLVLQAKGQVFKVDYMGYQGKVALGGFPVSIENIGVTTNETNANLYFDLAINLMGEKNGFSAKTNLGIISSFKDENYRQKWKFDRVELHDINLKANLGAFSMQGGLKIMNNDPEYGDGFVANLKVKFKPLKGVDIDARGIFGKTDFRYWQFEAMVDNLPPIGSGGLNLQGFGGGASYRMRRTDFSSSFSPTKIGYKPDASLGLGVKAMVIFNAVKKEIIKGRAGFEVVFNKNGGADFAGLYGQATFMNVKLAGMEKVADLMEKLKKNTVARKKFLGVDKEKIDNTWGGRNLLDKSETEFPQSPPESVPISAKMAITYDFRNDVLHGELDAFVNVPGGFVKGRQDNGRAGWAVIHLDSKEWYLYIGTPENRLGLKIGVGTIGVNTGGYFMAGSKLPSSPPPPPEVSEKLGVDIAKLNYMRKENALASGRGFAFGSNIEIGTGDLRFLIFYANFKVGSGFDVMLRNYGKAACKNTGRQVGINGWYANGQAYAYLDGELGVRVKLFFIKKKIPIIKGGAAVLLQAKLPNPVWMRGYVGGDFNLLGGLVKGKFRFKLTIGEECEFDKASPLGGIKIIGDVKPDDNTKNIDVFSMPQATFSMKVGKPIVIPEEEGDKTYKIILEEFKIYHKGKEIPGKMEMSNYGDVANFISTDILPPHQKLTVKVAVSFKEKIDGVFRTIMVDGKPAKEIEERTFTTGGAPSVIPLHNIEYSYPVINQKYFLEDEHPKGYIQLKRGQDYLFDDNQWKSNISYTLEDEQKKQEFSFVYNKSLNKINYDIPNLSQSAKYSISIVSKPNKIAVHTKGKTNYKKVNLANNSQDNVVTIKTKEAKNNSKEGEIERLHYKFGTSAYKTFKRKINSMSTDNYSFGIISSDVIYLSNTIKDHEPFDLIELKGSEHTNNKALVMVEAVLDDAYFKKDINPHLYAAYPLGGKYYIKNRKTEELGIPPKLALPILGRYLTNLEYDVNEDILRTTFPFMYNLVDVYKSDWIDMTNQIVNDLANGDVSVGVKQRNFLKENFLFMRYETYKIKLLYNLPGGIKGTQAIYKFKNPNNFR